MPRRPHDGARMHRLARTLRRDQTIVEGQLWNRLRGAQMTGFSFRRQFPIGGFIADFCCRKSRLVIELDGSQHADDPLQAAADKRRTAALEDRGYRVLRFWNEDISSNLEGVLEHILTELKKTPT